MQQFLQAALARDPHGFWPARPELIAEGYAAELPPEQR
jgi:hypothetical protein